MTQTRGEVVKIVVPTGVEAGVVGWHACDGVERGVEVPGGAEVGRPGSVGGVVYGSVEGRSARTRVGGFERVEARRLEVEREGG